MSRGDRPPGDRARGGHPRHDAPGPLSRPVRIDRLRKDASDLTVEATPAECAALAADFGIPAIRDLVGRFAASGPSSRLVVTGTVSAVVTQVCTVSLDPFESEVREPVEVVFTDTDILVGTDAEDADVPDPIIGNRIDLGTLTAEFLALGLDPYPRRPGIAFAPVTDGDEAGPLGALAGSRGGDG